MICVHPYLEVIEIEPKLITHYTIMHRKHKKTHSVLHYHPIQLENFSPYNELNSEKSIATIIVHIKRQMKLFMSIKSELH